MVDEELAGLLAAGERAVFRGVPSQGLIPLERAEALAAGLGDQGRRARAAWLLGVGRTSIGLFGQALAGLTTAASDPAIPEDLRSLPASGVGAVQRQLGRHAEQALSVFNPTNRMDNARRIATALDLLHQAGVEAISLKLPDTIPFLRDDGRYPTGELAARLRAWVRPVAQALDLRNGNDLLTQRLDQPAH